MLYNKFFESCYDELLTYYPKYYRDVFEMDAILKTHGRLADNMETNIEKVLNNGFIDTADEETIGRLEKFLYLSLHKKRTLEERRKLVKMFFIGFGKCSATFICKMLSAYTGASVSCKFEPFDEIGNNKLYIDIDRGKENLLYMSDILTLLDKKIPAHIEYIAAIVYKFPIEIQSNTKSYVYDYELTGTKPDITLFGQLVERFIKVNQSHTNSLKDYKFPLENGFLSGTEPDVAIIGIVRSFIEEIQTNRRNILTDYELSGTNPDIALFGQVIKSILESKQEYENILETFKFTDDTLTGIEPNTALLGLIEAFKEEIQTKYNNILEDYKISSENAETGEFPCETKIGDNNKSNTAATTRKITASVNYIPCGTRFTNQS